MKAWRVIFAARKILHQSLCQQKLITVNLRTAPSTSSSLRNLVYLLNASCSADTVVMNYSYIGLCRHEVYIHGPMCDLCWPRPVLCYLSGSSAASCFLLRPLEARYRSLCLFDPVVGTMLMSTTIFMLLTTDSSSGSSSLAFTEVFF